jgi:hypothetical protein
VKGVLKVAKDTADKYPSNPQVSNRTADLAHGKKYQQPGTAFYVPKNTNTRTTATTYCKGFISAYLLKADLQKNLACTK